MPTDFWRRCRSDLSLTRSRETAKRRAAFSRHIARQASPAGQSQPPHREARPAGAGALAGWSRTTRTRRLVSPGRAAPAGADARPPRRSGPGRESVRRRPPPDPKRQSVRDWAMRPPEALDQAKLWRRVEHLSARGVRRCAGLDRRCGRIGTMRVACPSRLRSTDTATDAGIRAPQRKGWSNPLRRRGIVSPFPRALSCRKRAVPHLLAYRAVRRAVTAGPSHVGRVVPFATRVLLRPPSRTA